MGKPYIFRLLLALAALAAQPVAAGQDDGTTVAITANGLTLVELYRDDDGSLRYQINDDVALGMSMGLAPPGLVVRPGAPGFNARWLPLFDLYREPSPDAYLLPEQSIREARARRWFWSLGTHGAALSDDGFDFRYDLARNFSLQGKAGFLVPLGRRWVLGGALTLDHVSGYDGFVDPAAPAAGTSVGAFLGIEFSY